MGDLDNGLGLEAFVKGSEAAGDASASSQAAEQQAEGKGQSAESTEQSAEGSEQGGAKEDSKSSPSEPAGGEQPAESKEEKTEGGGQPAEGSTQPGKEEQAQTANWDSEENPYRQEAARLQERIVGANRWSNEVHKQNLELRRSLERLEKKIDGTFDPEEEQRAEAAERAAQGSPEDAAQLAELRGATVASLHMAYETMGREKTDAAVREFDSLFQNNPLVMQRVTASRRPVQEALKILSEFKIAQKYGTQDLTQMIEKIREEAVAQAMPALTEKITKEIMGKLDLKNKENGGLKHLRGSGRDSATEQLSEAAKNEHKPLSELFTAG